MNLPAVVAQQEPPQRTRRRRQHDVVERDPEVLAGFLDVGEGKRRRREPAPRAHHVVDEARRRGEVAGQIGMLAPLLGPATDPRHPGRRLPHQPRQFPDQSHVIASGGLQQIRACPGRIGAVGDADV